VTAYVTAVLLVIAVAFSFMRAFQGGEGADFGWLAIGLVILAVWLVPTLTGAANAASRP
jgi:hypothetical protein